MPRAWRAALCLLLSAASVSKADVRPYGVDDLLALESLGQVKFDPRERIVVVERRRRYDTATDYTYAAFTPRLLSNVLFTTLDNPGPLEPLFPQEKDAGYWVGDFSPSGRRLTVFRLAHRRLDLGVVDLDRHTVAWLPIAPDLPVAHPAPSWLDDDTLVAVAFKERRLPFVLSLDNAIETDLPRLWAAAASGRTPSVTVAGSGSISNYAGGREVVRLDVRSGKVVTLASGNVTDVAVSRRGNVAIVSTTTPSSPPPGETLSPAFTPLRHALDVSRSGSTTTTRVDDDVLPANLSWDDDGERLAFVALGGTWRDARFRIATVRRDAVSVRSLQNRPVATISQGSGLLARDSWAGARLLLETESAGGAAEWLAVDASGRSGNPVRLGSGQLAVADKATAWLVRGRTLTRHQIFGGRSTTVRRDVSVSSTVSLDPSSVGPRLLFNPTDQRVALATDASGGSADQRVLDKKGVSGTPMSTFPGSKILAVGRRHVAAFHEDGSGVGVLELASAGSPTIEVARINGFLADRAMPRVLKLRTRLSDGEEHVGWLFLPPAPTIGTAPPLVVLVYPGALYDRAAPTYASPSLFAPMASVPIMVGRGFAVLIPALPEDAKAPSPLDQLASDAGRALDAAIATRLVDPDRIALLGHSFGGYGALGIATRSARYRAVVAASGPYDLPAIYGQMAGPDRIRLEVGLPFVSGAGWSEGGQGGMVLPPWKAPERYVVKSPYFSLGRVLVPVLLSSAETDYVGMDQAEGAFMGLARQGRDVTLLRYWGQGHVLSSPANIRDYWTRIVGWLDDRLGMASHSTGSAGAGSPGGVPAAPSQ